MLRKRVQPKYFAGELTISAAAAGVWLCVCTYPAAAAAVGEGTMFETSQNYLLRRNRPADRGKREESGRMATAEKTQRGNITS